MPLPKRKFREIVFQLLYSHDLSLTSAEDTIPMLMEELAVSKANMREAHLRMQEIDKRREEVDQIISEATEGYEVDRIHRVERNILRIAFYELNFDDEIPPKVVVAEAVRLARKFGSPEAGSFVNAILDQAYQETLPPREEDEDKNEIYFGNDKP